jgi:ABC-type transport system involved in multi-copper enzyme maturation permease subunit
MDTMQSIKKEIKYGLRSSRFLILAAGLFFFALLDPVMTKVLLPAILQGQFPDMPAETLKSMFTISQTACVQTYMGDVFEIGTIIIVFTLCGVVAHELKENTLVIPVCSGKSFGSIAFAKLLVFGSALILIVTAALIADYAYAGALMGFEINVIQVIKGGLLQGMYMVFILSCLMLFGSLIKKPIAAGILTLIVAYGSHFIGGALKIEQYMPTGLMSAASSFAAEADAALPAALIVTAAATALMYLLSVIRIKSIELGQRQ